MSNLLILSPAVYMYYVNEAAKLNDGLLWAGHNVENWTDASLGIQSFNVNGMDYEELLPLAERLMQTHPFDRIETPYEFYMENAAKLREHFGLPGLTLEQTLPMRDKNLMKKAFQQAGVPCARHRRIDRPDDLLEFVQEVGLPLILKPLSMAGSVNTFKVEALEEAMQRCTYFLDELGEPFQAEECILIRREGSYDAVVVDGDIVFGTICEYDPVVLETAQKPGGHRIYIRHDLPEELDRAIREAGDHAIRALGVTHSLCHVEYFVDEDGRVLIGELGARVAGARIPELIGYSQGFSYQQAWAEHLMQRRFTPRLDRSSHSGILFIAAEGDGVISEVQNAEYLLDKYRDMIVEYKLPLVGDPVKTVRKDINDVEAIFFVKHPSSAAVKSALDEIHEKLIIR